MCSLRACVYNDLTVIDSKDKDKEKRGGSSERNRAEDRKDDSTHEH